MTAQAEKIIARPLEVVQAQFVDMQHHASTRVHADLEVANVRALPDGWRITGRRRVLGKLLEDEIEVLRDAEGNSTLRGISGPNAGFVISQRFEALDAGRTRVRTSVELPVRGFKVLLRPLLRMGLQRDLVTALEEDRRDLEEKGYQLAA
ncbi:hypothetical protein UC35_16470 [Ramlibacter tataouinensis]|uniref:Polyketide cyclase n=1 Tax=Ramlibacter tataouinensis TaxID=94132 RepID=A0A127JW48_9BURK|nr:hypothetical protein UC35_16470 [Ramlibacter tataouinensis]